VLGLSITGSLGFALGITGAVAAAPVRSQPDATAISALAALVPASPRIVPDLRGELNRTTAGFRWVVSVIVRPYRARTYVRMRVKASKGAARTLPLCFDSPQFE
jgi:hypothetical protein